MKNHSFIVACVVSLIAGSLTVLGFAPFYWAGLPFLTLALLCWLVFQPNTPRRAAWLAFWFGMGLYCVGIHWLYFSLHDIGGMPAWMTVPVLLVLGAFLALFPAAAALLAAHPRFYRGRALVFPAAWALLEWVRCWIFTGFPWLAVGYSQIPNSPLAGFAPVLGVYGVSFLLMLAASLLAIALIRTKQDRKKPWRPVLITLPTLLLGGFALQQIQWTHATGKPISVALLQGNISQEMKWDANLAMQHLQTYLDLSAQSSAQLTILPESAVPFLSDDIPPGVFEPLKLQAIANDGNFLLGIIEHEPTPTGSRYYNSAISIGVNPTQLYRKSHLVPFGEFIPLKSLLGWIYRDWLNMPLSDMSPGGFQQTPMQLGEQKVAVNICYEDVFGEEIIKQLPQATVLVNMTNDAWFGNSIAPYQHLQIAQTRALETGRMMLRATNTGATAIIDKNGQLVATLPHFSRGILNGQAQGYSGTTPYVRWGNWAIVILMLSLLAWALLKTRKTQ